VEQSWLQPPAGAASGSRPGHRHAEPVDAAGGSPDAGRAV